METSTPLRRRDLRRSVLTATVTATPTVYTSPLRRHRNKETGENPPPALTVVDNEKEISARRSMVQMHQRLSNISSTFSPLGDVAPIIDESQIKDQLHICTKLYAENRISAKNAWKLQIIDVMRSMTRANFSNILQVAGSSLDISAKVYGLRVDDVHSKGFQLASSMSKSGHKPSEGGDDNNLDQSSLNRQPARKNARKKVRKMTGDKRNTIDKEEKGVYTSIKHIESVVFATQENIDVSSQDNLFTNKVPINATNHQFMLLSNEKHWAKEMDRILEKADHPLDIVLPSPSHYNTCVPFKEFEIGTWDPDQEAIELAQLVVDDQGIPYTNLDGSIHDIFDDDNIDPHLSDSEEIQIHTNFENEAHIAVEHIQDAIPEEYRVENDYSYNPTVKTSSGKFIDRIWAGPSHWKVKCTRRSSVRFSGCTQHVVKHIRKTTKEPQAVGFKEDNFDLDDLDLASMKRHTLKKIPQTVPSQIFTLPLTHSVINYGKVIKELVTTLHTQKNPMTSRGDEQIKVYNYDNPNDSMYCSQNSADDLNNDEPPVADDPVDKISNADSQQSQQNFVDENLITAPEMVSATQLKYALHAKKMDMKKLKNAVWKMLTQNEIENGTSRIKPIQFSVVYKKLPQMLPNDMRKELTCPLALVALLHLCNENNLELQQDQSCKDFTITK